MIGSNLTVTTGHNVEMRGMTWLFLYIILEPGTKTVVGLNIRNKL